MITSARPITTLISNADKVCSETQLSHSTHSDEDEKERVVMGFDVRHRSTVSKEMKESQSFRVARYGLEVRRVNKTNSSYPGPLRAFHSWPPCSCETCEEHEGEYCRMCSNTAHLIRVGCGSKRVYSKLTVTREILTGAPTTTLIT
jgi:hypothetical protein